MGTSVRPGSDSTRRKNDKQRAELTQAVVREYFDYNPATGVVLIAKQRGTARVGDVAGFIGHQGYREVKIDHFANASPVVQGGVK
jgi:hypothetical protein